MSGSETTICSAVRTHETSDAYPVLLFLKFLNNRLIFLVEAALPFSGKHGSHPHEDLEFFVLGFVRGLCIPLFLAHL